MRLWYVRSGSNLGVMRKYLGGGDIRRMRWCVKVKCGQREDSGYVLSCVASASDFN